MTTPLANFKLTVVSRLAHTSDRPSLSRLRKAIREVLAVKDLAHRSREEYENDMKELAVLYRVDVKEVLDLVPG